MILDGQSLFSDEQAITASAASTNYIDFLNARELGFGDLIPLLIQVVEDFTNLTSLKVGIQIDDNSSFNSPTTVMETEVVLLASLVAGYSFNLNYVPKGANERYMRLYYTVAGSAPDAGKITAGFVPALQQGHHDS